MASESARSRTSSSPESPPTGSAPRPTIFMPVYSFGLCEAVTAMPPSSPSEPTAKYSISVPTSPSSSTSAPPSLAPSIAARAIPGDDSRMSWPTAIRPSSNCST